MQLKIGIDIETLNSKIRKQNGMEWNDIEDRNWYRNCTTSDVVTSKRSRENRLTSRTSIFTLLLWLYGIRLLITTNDSTTSSTPNIDTTTSSSSSMTIVIVIVIL